MLMVRAMLVVSLAALLAVGAVSAMTFIAPPTHPLRALATSFGSHPEALSDRAMGEIGSAAARGATVPASARRAMISVSRNAPLAPDPFLVEGTIAEMNRDPARAERLFLAARNRDPRSQGARYFLADRFLKTNRILPGLVELGALARLSERAAQPLIPALAAYARTPGATTELRRYFKLSPVARDQTLSLLAQDASNAPLILSLAPEALAGGAPADWHGRLIQSLVTAGDYAGADALWRRVSGVANRGLVFNPEFRASTAPPPFNWQYPVGSAGVAEATGSGGLDVVYYGREEAVLALQMLRLAPGGYRLSLRADGPSRRDGLAWTIACVPDKAALLRLPIGTGEKGRIAGAFAVPATGCPAQMLELRARPADVPQTEQVTILDLRLEPLAARP